MKNVTGVLVNAGYAAMVTIPAGLPNMQAMVGGLIERIGFPGIPHDVDCYVNEEGLLQDLPRQAEKFSGEAVCGPIFYCGSNTQGETISLSEARIKQILIRYGAAR
jgi:hypothetical protein